MPWGRGERGAPLPQTRAAFLPARSAPPLLLPSASLMPAAGTNSSSRGGGEGAQTPRYRRKERGGSTDTALPAEGARRAHAAFLPRPRRRSLSCAGRGLCSVPPPPARPRPPPAPPRGRAGLCKGPPRALTGRRPGHGHGQERERAPLGTARHRSSQDSAESSPSRRSAFGKLGLSRSMRPRRGSVSPPPARCAPSPQMRFAPLRSRRLARRSCPGGPCPAPPQPRPLPPGQP